MPGLPPSPQVRAALATATEAHAGQIRNGAGGIPYIQHPIAVAELLAAHGWTDEVLAAALLHDVVEDSDKDVAELRQQFGDPIAGLVEALSDDESISDWTERKAEHRGRVGEGGEEALAIYAADKLTNVKALRDAYAEQGEAVAEELKVPLEYKIDAWQADLEMLRARAPELPFLDELESGLSLFRADRAAAGPRSGT
ncbi:MAG TPA: HD domain-containing protein [Solirubrobacterales bacterium]|nr:HD domain-containing protein [Solirubrobacterales bacterium]